MEPNNNNLDPQEVLKGLPKFKFSLFVIAAIAVIIIGWKCSFNEFLTIPVAVLIVVVGAVMTGKLNFHIVRDDY